MSTRRLGLVSDAPVDSAGPRLRVAMATQDGRSMNAHFGSAKRFVVYDVMGDASRFVETIAFDEVSDESGTHTVEGDDKNGRKISALSGVDLLFVQAIGGPVAARVIRAEIHPIKLSVPEPVEKIVQKVQDMLVGETPPWLRKILQQRTARSMDFLDEDD
ncbi:MAG: Protein nifX [Pseudomonadota bacterium]